MPLTLLRAPTNAALWSACTERFFAANAGVTGPEGYGAFLWLTHRTQRDLLFHEAERRGISGWLAPPFAFFSQLPRRFNLRARPVGSVRRRLLLTRIAAREAEAQEIPFNTGLHAGAAGGIDRLIGSLLPESIHASDLESTLADAADDDFARRRNAWIVSTYRAYLEALDESGAWDPRAVHGFVADRIAEGHLPEVIGGARTLLIYGQYSLHTRRRLLSALRDQPEVEVFAFIPPDGETTEWDELGAPIERLEGDPPPAPTVVATPDGRRELEYVALEIKRRLRDGERPEDLAVVVRTGREDTARAQEILGRAGIPVTARVRSPLSEVPALKAIVHLLRAAAHDWAWRPLRQVLESAYFDLDVDLRGIDAIAAARRMTGVRAWLGEVERLRDRARQREEARNLARQGLFEDRLARDVEVLRHFADRATLLGAERSLVEWIALTRELLDPGWFDYRARLCRPDGGDWDVVRLDQHAVDFVDRLLREWETAGESDEPIGPGSWLRRLQVLLRSTEIAVGTPQQTGVRILEAHEAALVPFTHTFIVHANDGIFPRRTRAGTLFTEEELESLAPAGFPVPSHGLRQQRERSLWRAVAAGANVTITYRTADPNGVPLLPSIMVPAEVSREIPRTQFVWDEPFNPHQQRMHAAHQLVTAAPRIAVPPRDVHPVRRAVVHAVAEIARREPRPGSDCPAGAPGPWNGQLTDPVVLERIAERFGPQRRWSASQLEGYAQNPFVYFLQRVLYLDEFDEADEETTPLTSGGVAHDILEKFYEEYAGPFPGTMDDSTRDLLHRIASDVFTEREARQEEWLGVPLLWGVTKRHLRQMLEEFLAFELPTFDGRHPVEREFAFGGDESLVLTGSTVEGGLVSMPVRGKVDRIDLDTRRDTLHVIDYKSNTIPYGTHYEDGTALQTALYMAAVAELETREVETGTYRSIKKRNDTKKMVYGDPNFHRALRIAFSIPDRIRSGLFEARASHYAGWKNYWPGSAITRVEAVFAKGEDRFHD